MEKDTSNKSDNDLTLHYLDKVHTTLIETGRSANNIMLVWLTDKTLDSYAAASWPTSVEKRLSCFWY
jgi:hypothetical protein